MSLVFDFADIANRMNRAAKTEPMAVVKAEPEIDWAAVFSSEYDAALSVNGDVK